MQIGAHEKTEALELARWGVGNGSTHADAARVAARGGLDVGQRDASGDGDDQRAVGQQRSGLRWGRGPQCVASVMVFAARDASTGGDKGWRSVEASKLTKVDNAKQAADGMLGGCRHAWQD